MQNKYWAFVVPSDSVASKSRHTATDATAIQTSGDDFRQKVITPFNIYLFIPTKNEIAGRASYDDMVLITSAIFKSILGASLPSPYYIESFSRVVFEAHGHFAYSGAYYIHKMEFSVVDDLIIEDTIRTFDDVAFRDLDCDIINSEDEIIADSTIKLDEG